MDKRTRVLVVEDIETLRDSYLANLEREGYRVDGAADLVHAESAIHRCTYHVAIVDIMLAGEKNIANRDGVKVLQLLRELNEGTSAIVVSGQSELQLVRDFFKEFGAFDYVYKYELERRGVAALLEIVRRSAAASPVNKEPSWDELSGVISFGTSEQRFASECLDHLHFKGGFENLSRALVAASRHLLPLLVPNRETRSMTMDSQRQVMRGDFWAKGQSQAVEILIGEPLSIQSLRAQPGSQQGEELWSREKGGLSVIVRTRPQGQRSDYHRVSS